MGRAARLGALTRLALPLTDYVVAERGRLAALLTGAGWAGSLVKLELGGGDDLMYDAPAGADVLRSLGALPELPRLRTLRLVRPGLSAAEIDAAIADGAAGWASRAVELRVEAEPLGRGYLPALARLPFARLERLTIEPAAWCDWVRLADLHAFGEAGAAWLGRLAALELSALVSDEELPDALAELRDPAGALAALHAGGGALTYRIRERESMADDPRGPPPGAPRSGPDRPPSSRWERRLPA